MDILVAFLMVFPIVGLTIAALLLALMAGVGVYSGVEWWRGRRQIVREAEVSLSPIKEKISA